MHTPRLIGACAATAAGAVMVLIVASVALTPATPTPPPPRSLAGPAMGAPIAYGIERPGISADTSVPPASGLSLPNPSDEAAPTF